jgi:hypothetical protein
MALVFLFFREKKEKSLLHHLVTCLCLRAKTATKVNRWFACARRAAPDFWTCLRLLNRIVVDFICYAKTD